MLPFTPHSRPSSRSPMGPFIQLEGNVSSTSPPIKQQLDEYSNQPGLAREHWESSSGRSMAAVGEAAPPSPHSSQSGPLSTLRVAEKKRGHEEKSRRSFSSLLGDRPVLGEDSRGVQARQLSGGRPKCLPPLEPTVKKERDEEKRS